MYKIRPGGELLLMIEPLPEVATTQTETSPEVALVEAARLGDRAACAKLYAIYSPMVHGILLARVPRGEVSDLVQDVFLLALERFHTLRDSAAFGPWLAAITRNRANDFHRQTRTHEELNENLIDESPAEMATEAAKVLAAIRTLPDAYCETLILRLVEGMTGPEIAARTGLTPASVRVNLHRGMKLLRDKLGLEESL
ncbi:MAG: sigma-70 family RNA polymerase sigma factor [Acidobacteriota bacterium]